MNEQTPTMTVEPLRGDEKAPPAVRAIGLTRVFEGGHVRAVDGLDLEIGDGASVAICGASGSGKSTLLNLIAGIDRPDAGTLHVAGRELTSLSDAEMNRYRREMIGLIFQLHNLLPSLTALENVQVPTVPLGLENAERLDRARELLDAVGMAERGHAYPTVLSGGERQRVAIARALVNRPRILLADEPTGSLDSGNSERLLDLLASLQRRFGTTLILVTHEPQVAARAERMIRLSDGRIVEDSSA